MFISRKLKNKVVNFLLKKKLLVKIKNNNYLKDLIKIIVFNLQHMGYINQTWKIPEDSIFSVRPTIRKKIFALIKPFMFYFTL
jgi:hypothetical protein